MASRYARALGRQGYRGLAQANVQTLLHHLVADAAAALHQRVASDLLGDRVLARVGGVEVADDYVGIEEERSAHSSAAD
jgi:hypothetical protein